MPVWKSKLASIPVGLYEKALPQELTWHERLETAVQAGYDFLEMVKDIVSDDRYRRIE